MNLIGYIRVSTEAQADNTSLEEQKNRIEAYCQAYGHRLAHLFTEVGSASNTHERPQFQEALKRLQETDGLIACKLDRVARNTKDVLNLVEDVLKPQKKALILLDLNIDTSSPYGHMMLTIMAAVAQLERDIITERTQSGRKAKAKTGGYAFGAPPYGYTSVDGVLIEILEEQGVIKLAKRHRRSGKSFQKVAEYLNKCRLPGKRGRIWHGAQIRRILARANSQIQS